MAMVSRAEDVAKGARVRVTRGPAGGERCRRTPGACACVKAHGARGQGGFTLVELLFSFAVVAVLMGLLIVGLRMAARGGRQVVDQQAVNSLKIGVEQFKRDFGFLPPLVKDDQPLTQASGPWSPNIYLESIPADFNFLRGASLGPNSADRRFSVYSLSYYLIGALGQASDGTLIDGIDGPGFREPRADGTFRTTGGRRIEPLFEVARGSQGVVAVDPVQGRFELRDRQGNAFRFYRWVRGDANGQINDLSDLNIPLVLGDPEELTELRGADYAILGAGPNGVFGDLPIEGASFVKQQLGMRESDADAVAERKAREDNVLEVGG